MTMRIDHVAVAAPDLERSERVLVLPRHGHLAKWDPRDDGLFAARQYRFSDAGRLEILSPNPAAGDTFLTDYLARHGASIHHVTMMVDDFDVAVDHCRTHGLQPVGINRDLDLWHEAFLSPRQVGGLVIQLAWEPHPNAPALDAGTYNPPAPHPDAARLIGVALRHPDLAEATRIWSTLGATCHDTADGVACQWEDAPLQVHLHEGATAGPMHLVFDGGGARDADDDGPAVVDVSRT
jgi:methylmalonyl-CoA/ethylmalonyl-CoA epimerase